MTHPYGRIYTPADGSLYDDALHVNRAIDRASREYAHLPGVQNHLRIVARIEAELRAQADAARRADERGVA